MSLPNRQSVLPSFLPSFLSRSLSSSPCHKGAMFSLRLTVSASPLPASSSAAVAAAVASLDQAQKQDQELEQRGEYGWQRVCVVSQLEQSITAAAERMGLTCLSTLCGFCALAVALEVIDADFVDFDEKEEEEEEEEESSSSRNNDDTQRGGSNGCSCLTSEELQRLLTRLRDPARMSSRIQHVIQLVLARRKRYVAEHPEEFREEEEGQDGEEQEDHKDKAQDEEEEGHCKVERLKLTSSLTKAARNYLGCMMGAHEVADILSQHHGFGFGFAPLRSRSGDPSPRMDLDSSYVSQLRNVLTGPATPAVPDFLRFPIESFDSRQNERDFVKEEIPFLGSDCFVQDGMTSACYTLQQWVSERNMGWHRCQCSANTAAAPPTAATNQRQKCNVRAAPLVCDLSNHFAVLFPVVVDGSPTLLLLDTLPETEFHPWTIQGVQLRSELQAGLDSV